MNELPEKFAARMRRLLGAEADGYFRAVAAEPTKGLHVNTTKCKTEDVLAEIEGLTPFVGDNCFAVTAGRPARHPYHAAGLFYMQEPSAMLPVAALGAVCGGTLLGKRVLDLCAAPGGKTSQLATLTAGTGLLVSNEIELDRARILQENTVRMGYRNIVVTCLRPPKVADTFGGFFDVAVVDAPCSGEGMFRKEPQAAMNWSEANVRACAVRQKEILRSADACLIADGLLLYSTCTFSEEEDEEVVRFLRGMGYVSVPVPDEIARLGKSMGDGIKFFPHTCGGEGQFFCLMRKKGSAARGLRGKRLQPAGKTESAAVRAVAEIDGFIAKDGDRLFLPACDFDLPCLSNGVVLGRFEKGRFTPAHALFTSLSDVCRSREDLSLSDPRVVSYLAGEEIEGSAEGWCAVRVNGFALGGGKGVRGCVKNHYPKSLRVRR